MIEKDYLPQYAAELVVDLERSYKILGDIAYKNMAEMVRNAAHIVLPVNGEIYRDVHLNISKEECVSTGVMPHMVTTFEYPVNDQYFLVQDSESTKPLFPDSSQEAVITMVIDHKLNPYSPLDDLGYKESELGKRYPISIFNFTKFKTDTQKFPIANWRMSTYYMALLTPLVMGESGDWQSTEINILKTFTLEKILESAKSYTKEDIEAISEKEGIHPYNIITMHMAGMSVVAQACHSLRVGATLEQRQDKSYTRNRTFQKKGAGGFEYHVLRLPHGTVKETLGSRCGGGERDGPRYHFRRAHLRNLPKGTQTFVRSCFVGNRDKGVVEKNYELDREVAV
jgi:hypothetical protein